MDNEKEPPSIDSFKMYLSCLIEEAQNKKQYIDNGNLTKSANKIFIKELEVAINAIDNVQKQMKVVSYFSSNKL